MTIKFCFSHSLIRFILLIAVFAVSNTVQAQSCKKKYKDKLESRSKLVECGGNYTKERLRGKVKGKFIYKRYHPEKMCITHIKTYKSFVKNILHGLYEERWDDGTVVTSGMYEDNTKEGVWRDSLNQVGSYVNGLRQGEWKVYKKDSLVKETINYKDGLLHGKKMEYDTLGVVVLEELYHEGKLIETIQSSKEEQVLNLPCLQECHTSIRSQKELKDCTEKRLLSYIYSNLRYPSEARAAGIEGEAWIDFTIEKDGKISSFIFRNAVCNEIEDVLLPILQNMPKWSPGTVNGEPVRVKHTLPVRFKLFG